ncbi:chromate efflux transporter [Microbacterium sp. SSW1-59]|uniref:chromate efflux transporter n=1 Tax=Microbacterium xanthum TaxID=3079794 RepID=UPI003A0FE104
MTGPPDPPPATTAAVSRGTIGEVFLSFLKLGVTSFGGPVAHLGYFRDELVTRRRWIDDREYADLVALSQFLPGPASSQVGFGLGMLRAGAGGALAAFIAFTLPSAALMIAFALIGSAIVGPVGVGILEGLKVVAVAVVAQAVWGMARTLAPDRQRAGIAVGAAVLVVLVSGSVAQIGAIVAGALLGLWLCRSAVADTGPGLSFPVPRVVGVLCLSLFVGFLVGLPLLAATTGSGVAGLIDAFYRAGALVFGGGHVVLPLLEAEVVAPGWVDAGEFLAGYGVAQAMPGPLFTFAAYLGAVSTVGPGGVAGGVIALLAVFLPGLLLLTGVLPFWNGFRRRSGARAAMAGANAAVVGILAAALYDPVFTSAVLGPASFSLALVCFALLTAFRVPPWIVVLIGATGGVVIALI